MRIEVSQVQQQLAEESTYLEKALVDTEDLIIELNNFVFENNLTGSAYLSVKIFYSSVMLPLAKAMAHMYQAKLNANHRYSSSLRSFFGSITYIDQAELQERLDATRRRRRSLEDDDDDDWIPWRLIRRLRAIERLLRRKIESVDEFDYLTANYYTDFQSAVTLVKQGFESANKVQYSGVSGYNYNFSLALSWAKTVDKLYHNIRIDSGVQPNTHSINSEETDLNVQVASEIHTESHVHGGTLYTLTQTEEQRLNHQPAKVDIKTNYRTNPEVNVTSFSNKKGENEKYAVSYMHRGKRYTVYLTKEQYLQYQEVMKNYPRDAALLSAAVILLGLGIQLGANSIAGGTFVGSNVEQVVENEGQFTKFNWEIINGTQELIEGTNVPKSFVINNLT